VIRYSSEVTIDRPPRVVFDALLDPNRYGEWTPMVDMEFDGDGPPRLGTTGRFRLSEGPVKDTLETVIVELETERRIVFRTTHPALTWLATIDLRPAGERTHVTYGGEMALHGWKRLLEPIIAAEVKVGEAREIEKLKSILEAERPNLVPA
jgi:uncharacterized protein YndB with AHSA1/START domain